MMTHFYQNLFEGPVFLTLFSIHLSNELRLDINWGNRSVTAGNLFDLFLFFVLFGYMMKCLIVQAADDYIK